MAAMYEQTHSGSVSNTAIWLMGGSNEAWMMGVQMTKVSGLSLNVTMTITWNDGTNNYSETVVLNTLLTSQTNHTFFFKVGAGTTIYMSTNMVGTGSYNIFMDAHSHIV